LQTHAAATGKARSKMVERHVSGMINDDNEADLSRRRVSRSANRQRSSARYGGPSPCRHLNANHLWLAARLRLPRPYSTIQYNTLDLSARLLMENHHEGAEDAVHMP